MAGLEALPAEIILQIHLISTSSSLPTVSRYVHSCISHNATPLYRARWLTLRLASEGIRPSAASSSSSSASNNNGATSTRASCITGGNHNSARKGKRRRPHLHHDDSSSSSNDICDPDAIFLSRAIRYGACDLQTLRLLEQRCLDNLHKRLLSRYREQLEAHVKREVKKARLHPVPASKDNTNSKAPQEPPYPTFLPLPPRAVDIPKRLFRNLPTTSTPPPSRAGTQQQLQQHDTTTSVFENRDLPLLLHIMTTLQANPNSSRGYALAKAVLARHVPLIHLLLEHGADPSTKDHMAVMLAIGRNDIEVVKLLVERSASSGTVRASSPCSSVGTLHAAEGSTTSKNRKRLEDAIVSPTSSSSPSRSSSSNPKKRRLEDRISVTSEMLELAVKQQHEPLIHYFMSKGAVPNLKTLQMLQS